MTRDEMIEIVKRAEADAYRAWWGGGRDSIDDRDRQDEMDRRRRAVILDAIEPSIRADECERLASTDFGAKSVFRRAYLDWAEWGKESRQLSLGALDAAFEALDAYRRGER